MNINQAKVAEKQYYQEVFGGYKEKNLDPLDDDNQQVSIQNVDHGNS